MHINVKVIETTFFVKISFIQHDFRKITDSVSIIISCYVRYLL